MDGPTWYEVWAPERTGATPIPILWYKFPARQWTPEFRDATLKSMAEQGVTNVKVIEVYDGTDLD